MSNSRCSACRDGQALNFPISMAFQPVCDLQNRKVFAHEALVRGPQGESAGSLLQQVDADNLYAFDQACRIKAVEWGARLNLPGLLSITNKYLQKGGSPGISLLTSGQSAPNGGGAAQSFGLLDFQALNPYTSGGIPVAPTPVANTPDALTREEEEMRRLIEMNNRFGG